MLSSKRSSSDAAGMLGSGLDGMPQRRDSNDIARLHTVILTYPAAVDPHLATSQAAVDSLVAGYPSNGPTEIVDALPRMPIIDDNALGRARFVGSGPAIAAIITV